VSRILVVDDMTLCREPIAEALRSRGHEVFSATSGSEALARIRDEQPNLVLLDVNMPEMDGLTTLKVIRQNPAYRNVPVLLLTERADRESILVAKQHGVQGYLLKSAFSLDELFERVDKCLQLAAHGSQCKEDGVMSPVGAGATMSTALEPLPRADVGSSGRDAPRTARTSLTAKPPDTGLKFSPAEREKLLARVCEDLELRPLGTTVQNVVAATSSAGCCADDVARAVSNDQALTIRLLKLANSSAYSRGRPVSGIKAAIQRLGIQEVHRLVIALNVLENYSGCCSSRIDPHLFWEHSLACGLIARAIARARHVQAVDDYFLWGILHDVGRLLLMEHEPKRYESILVKSSSCGEPLERVEMETLLLDHCEVLGAALKHWRFNRDFIIPVTSHHLTLRRLERLEVEHRDAAATIALADRLAHALLLGASGNETIHPLDDLVMLLAVPSTAFSQIAELAPSDTRDLKLSMLARANADGWPEYVETVRRTLTKPLRPLCISASPELDAYRLFFERVSAAAPEGPPNLCVAYVHADAKLAPIFEKLEAAEAEAGGSGTPVLVISDNDLSANDWLRTRRYQILPTPSTSSQLLRSAEDLISSA